VPSYSFDIGWSPSPVSSATTGTAKGELVSTPNAICILMIGQVDDGFPRTDPWRRSGSGCSDLVSEMVSR